MKKEKLKNALLEKVAENQEQKSISELIARKGVAAVEFIKKHLLNPVHQLEVIETSDASLILAMIDHQTLCPEAEMLMFDVCDEETLKRFVQKPHCLSEKAVEKMMLYASEEIIALYLETHNYLDHSNELALITFHEKIAHDLIGKFKLSVEGEAHLLDYPKLLRVYLQRHRLGEEVVPEFFAKEYSELNLLYVSKYKMCEKNQCMLLARGNDAEIIGYINQRELCDTALAMLPLVSIPATFRYIELYGCLNDEAETNLMSSRNSDLVISYIAKQNLSIANQIKLINRGRKDEIMCFITTPYRFFSSEAEDALVLRGKNTELTAYVQKDALSVKNQLYLINEKKWDVVDAYGKYHKLCHDAEMLLMKQSDEDCFETKRAYLEAHALHNGAQLVLVNEANEKLIETYISNHALCNEALKAFINTASTVLLKMYCERYMKELTTLFK